jgi:hypothetical protein
MKAFSRWSSLAAKATLLSIVPTVSIAMAATSDDLFDNYFANVLDGRPCFARSYDESHLKAHQGQRVRKIEIDLSKNNADGTPNSADRFALDFAVMLTTGTEWFGQAASCKTDDADFECYLEGDGGIFRLTPRKDGGLTLESSDDGISIEGSNTEIQLSGHDGDDDRVFDLVPSKEECQAASAYLSTGND